MLFSFFLVYAFFSITPSIFDSSLDGGVRNGSYLAFCLLPLFLQAYFIKLNKKELEKILKRENKLELAEQCFKFLETRTSLDLAGLTGDIFEH